MSRIAEETGIGRATLYKYFPDVESILLAWHDRTIGEHLQRLADAGDAADDADERLEAVLTAYAAVMHDSRGHANSELAALLHRGERVARPTASCGTWSGTSSPPRPATARCGPTSPPRSWRRTA